MSEQRYPVADQTSVTLAQGDGGMAARRFLVDEILPRFGNPILNRLEDGAWVTLGETELVVATDSFIVTPPRFPGGDIGRLAVTGTVNDVLASGGRPIFMTFGLVISEGFPVNTLRQILDSVRQTTAEAGIQIVAGDTKVLPRSGPLEILINTAGIGTAIVSGHQYEISCARPGDSIIITGPVGNHGLAVLSAREGLGFEQRVLSDCAPLHELLLPLLMDSHGVRALRDPTRGGLVGALVDIAEASELEVAIEEAAVPIQEEVRFGCEMLGLDPLHLVNEGKMVLVVDPARADKVLSQLRQHHLGRESAVIGTARKGPLPGRMILRSDFQERVIVRPEGQPLPRMC